MPYDETEYGATIYINGNGYDVDLSDVYDDDIIETFAE